MLNINCIIVWCQLLEQKFFYTQSPTLIDHIISDLSKLKKGRKKKFQSFPPLFYHIKTDTKSKRQ